MSRDCSNLLQAHYRLDGHPHVNPIHEVLIGDKRVYLIFPRSHSDLHSYVRARKRLREHEARRLFRQMAETVAACHEQGIVLRDLKLRKFVFADPQRWVFCYKLCNIIEPIVTLSRITLDGVLQQNHSGAVPIATLYWILPMKRLTQLPPLISPELAIAAESPDRSIDYIRFLLSRPLVYYSVRKLKKVDRGTETFSRVARHFLLRSDKTSYEKD